MHARTTDESPAGMLVCGGAARLPGGQGNGMLVLEMEVDRASLAVEAIHVLPELGGLKRLLECALVGTPITDVTTEDVAAIAGRYSSPFRNAARAALSHAVEAYMTAAKRRPVPFMTD